MCENEERFLLADLNAENLDRTKDKDVKRKLGDNGLKQIIDKATRVTRDTRSLIDIIATSHKQNALDTIVYGNSMSDHNLVGMIIKKDNRKFIPRMVYKRNYAKYDIDSFKTDLRNQSWTQVRNEASASNGWSTFKRLLKSVIDKHAPLGQKKIRGCDCPWLTNEIRKKTNERDFLLRKAKKDKRRK